MKRLPLVSVVTAAVEWCAHVARSFNFSRSNSSFSLQLHLHQLVCDTVDLRQSQSWYSVVHNGTRCCNTARSTVSRMREQAGAVPVP